MTDLELLIHRLENPAVMSMALNYHHLYQMNAERMVEAAVALRALKAENERLREALRLIELIGYREGEQAGWMVAHMCGVANDALEGRTSEHIWRLFPHHRATLNHGKDRDEAP